MLLGGETGVTYLRSQPEPVQERKPFALPTAHTDMRRVYAYLLQHRRIDREVLTAFAREKLVYESAEPSADKTKIYHNAVFVGLDEHGVSRHEWRQRYYFVLKEAIWYAIYAVGTLATAFRSEMNGW